MTITATRRLTDIKFEHEGAAVALVTKDQGGAANGKTTLIYKATNHISQDQVDKAATVSVSMQFPEFLRRFFGMYWEDSEVLSASLGYGMTEEFDWEDKTYKDYLDSKVQSISIMKSVYKAADVEKALSELTPDETLAILADQEMLEKAMSSALPKGESLLDKPNGDSMETILKSAHEEFVTKAVEAAVAVEKAAFVAQEAVLKAAQDKLTEYEAAAVSAVTKSRHDALAAVKPADQVEVLLKSLAPLDAEAFDVVIKSFAAQNAAEGNSELFVEAGANGVGEQDEEVVDRTQEILKAKYAPKKSEIK